MKKIGIIAAVLVLLVSGLVFAQPRHRDTGVRGPGRFENLTEEQTAELGPILEQMETLRTQMRESMAEYRAQAMEALAAAGAISQDRLEWMQRGWELSREEGWQFHGKGAFHGGDHHTSHHGRRGGLIEPEPQEQEEPSPQSMQSRRMPRGRW